jgi:hypothetical protein
MKFSTLAISTLLSSAAAFSPLGSTQKPVSKTSKYDAAVASLDGTTTTSKPLFDPLGLYPKDSPERVAGLIQPLEASVEANQQAQLLDPLGLYASSSLSLAEPSASLPFLPRPAHLDGSLPGDRGFDPFNFASNPDNLLKYRNSELKHARLAMLAAVGWPLAELFHKSLADSWQLPNALNLHDRVPSVLNGGLGNVSPIFWVAALAAAALVETFSGAVGQIQSADLGFDPLGLSSSKDLVFDPLGMSSSSSSSSKEDGRGRFLAESELFNGRLAMMAITGFAIQEWFTGNSVVDAIPVFFKPFNVVMEQLLASGAATSV